MHMMVPALTRIAGTLASRGLEHRLSSAEWIQLPVGTPTASRLVGKLDLVVSGPGAVTCRLFVQKDAALAGGKVTANLHCPGTTIVIEAGVSTRSPHVTLHVYTPDALIYLNLDDMEPILSRPLHVQATFYNGDGQLLYWGAGASSVDTRCVIDGAGRAITVGKDAMLSNDVYLRTHDGHSLIDLDTGELINSGGDITVGNHVWVGQDVLVVGPAVLGPGAIVGAKSLVKGDVPATSAAAGVVAKVLRRNVSWSRVPGSLAWFDRERPRFDDTQGGGQ